MRWHEDRQRLQFQQLGAPEGRRRKRGMVIAGQYRVTESFSIDIGIKGYQIDWRGCRLTADGGLYVKAGFQWDGPSGPTFDDKWNLLASLVHDLLYLMAHGAYIKTGIPAKGPFAWFNGGRPKADRLFRAMLRDAAKEHTGFRRHWLKIRADYYYWAVRTFGKPFWDSQG